VHVSSAVVRVQEARRAEVVARIENLPGAEIVAAEGTKLVVVMETDGEGAAGTYLAEMSGFDGVLSACLVFEQSEPVASLGEPA